jgi:hypothetical protein
MPVRSSVAKEISEQLNRMLLAKIGQGELLKHNLEKGLGNEQALRDLLINFLPRRYGVAKGKIANSDGEMSRQLDVIIYDALNCPSLFVDENRNQILPIEGVFGVIEVKTTLTNDALSDSFLNLASVSALRPRRDASRNNFVTSCPPYLDVFAFRTSQPLQTIANQYSRLSKRYPVEKSCYAYSQKSPGYSENTGNTFLVCSVNILNKGSIFHMLDGTISTMDFGEYTLGMFVTGLLEEFDNIITSSISMTDYLNWIMVTRWRGSNPLDYARTPRLTRKK